MFHTSIRYGACAAHGCEELLLLLSFTPTLGKFVTKSNQPMLFNPPVTFPAALPSGELASAEYAFDAPWPIVLANAPTLSKMLGLI